MGVIYEFASLMAAARKKGTCFDQVVTLGHQTQCLSPREIKELASTLSSNNNLDGSLKQLENQEYIDELLKSLFEARSVTSIDYSNYENSDIIHDMNLPLPERYFEKYDIVIDGGTLEHIFNFPVAIANCMNLLKAGGSFFSFTPANNHMGHGFYQFSPELFYRIFRPENGFEIQDVILASHPYPSVELSSNINLYRVVDPARVRQRVGLVNRSPVMMMVHAIRKEIVPPFGTYPIQSDYNAIYRESGGESDSDAPGIPIGKFQAFKNRIHEVIGDSAWKKLQKLGTLFGNPLLKRNQLRHYSFSNRLFYQRIDRVDKR